MSDKLISVIVPVYNVELYIEKCVESICNQTYTSIEVILVDDGSTDSCPQKCDNFAKSDTRIKVIHKKNGGLSDARNVGIDLANGDYLMFVDGDDYIDENMCQVLLDTLEKYGADISICNFKYVGENLADEFVQMNQHMPIKDEVISGRRVIENKVMGPQSWYWVVAWNKLYSRRLFESVRFPKGKTHEDEFIFHEIFMQCRGVACTSQALYLYVQRGNSIMNSSYKPTRLDAGEARLQRANALIDAGYSSECIYFTAISGLFTVKQVYVLGKENDKEYRTRIKEIKRMYRDLGLIRLLKNVNGLGCRCKLAAMYIMPSFVWKSKL